MVARRKPTLLAQGNTRTLGAAPRAWRVRLYVPKAGGTKYQGMFRAPAGDGEPWKGVLRRANSEAEARKIFALPSAVVRVLHYADTPAAPAPRCRSTKPRCSVRGFDP